jgi:lipopolysaccharide transport system permease protein
MSASYLAPEVKIDPATGRASAAFNIRNTSGQTWHAAEGFAIGYHIFDAETGTLLVDGPRTPLAHDMAPGETAHVRLEFDLPAENGRYQTLISPLREGVCWYYEQGWRFLLVETAAEEGAVRLARIRVARRATLRRERAVRALGRALTYPMLTIWRNRGLIRVMVRRDVLGRYRGTFAGGFWTVISPLLLMLTYFFVFGLVLGARFEQDRSRSGFALYFLAGMLPWLAFSEAVGRAPMVVLDHRNFVKKLVFAVETLPVNLVAAGLVGEFFAIILYIVFLLLLRGRVPPTVIWLPALLVPQILFTAGLSWLLAALGVLVRDLGQVSGFVLTIWFFLTPICYPEKSLGGLPHSVTLLLSKNPIYVLVRGYRAIFLGNQAPAFGPLWKLWLLSAAVFLLGHAVFYKLRKSFADIV